MTSSAPHLMLVVPSISSYFAFLEELCDRMGLSGWKITLVTNRRHLPGINGYMRPVKANLHPVNIPRALQPMGCFQAALAVRRAARTAQPDLVHAHFFPSILFSALGGVGKMVPTLGTVHGVNSVLSERVYRVILRAAERWAFQRLDRVYVLNESDREYLTRMHMTCHVAAYTTPGLGCRLDRFNPETVMSRRKAVLEEVGFDGSEFVFIFIGRQTRFKGFAAVVKAFDLLREDCPDTRLLLVGAPDQIHPTGLTKNELAKLMQNDRVRRVGWQEYVEKYLAISHVNVFPSEREGMPVNLMESLAMGVPIITIDSRGCNEVVRDGVDGVVLRGVRRVSEVTAPLLAATMKEICSNRDKWQLFRRNALKNRSRFDRNAWVSEQMAIYDSILGRGPRI